MRTILNLRFIVYVLLLASHQSMRSTTLTIVNNSSTDLMICDNLSFAALLLSGEQQSCTSNQITLYFYQAERNQTPKTFRLTYRLKDLQPGNDSITINYLDIPSQAIHKNWPYRFETVAQTRLIFEQAHPGTMQQIQQKPNTSTTAIKTTQALQKQTKAHTSTTKSNQTSQAVVDALISQFSSMQDKKQTVDTGVLKPKRQPPTTKKRN